MPPRVKLLSAPLNLEGPDGIIFKNQDQALRYEFLKKRTLVPSRRMDWDLLESLGLLNEFENALEKLGWTTFAHIKVDSFKNLTLEFLSSLEQVKSATDVLPFGSIKFRLKNRDFHLTPDDISGVFGLPSYGYDSISSYEFDCDGFWSSISGKNERFDSQYAKASAIKSRVLKVLHRFLAHTLCARTESTGAVLKEELFILWCYVNNHAIHVGHVIADKLVHVSIKARGTIFIGMFVSTIAKSKGILLARERQYRIPFIDRLHLIGYQALRGSNLVYKDEQGTIKLVEIEAGDGETLRSFMEQRRESRATRASSATGAHSAARGRTSQAPVQGDSTAFNEIKESIAGLKESMETGFTSLKERIDGVQANVNGLRQEFQNLAKHCGYNPASTSQP